MNAIFALTEPVTIAYVLALSTITTALWIIGGARTAKIELNDTLAEVSLVKLINVVLGRTLREGHPLGGVVPADGRRGT